MPSRVSLAIVNDYEVVMHGLQAMLAPFEDRVRVTALDDPQIDSPVDVTLFDRFARGWAARSSALDAVLANPRAGRVVVYSWNVHPELVAQAMNLGCSGYLDKRSTGDELVAAVERIACGEVVISAPHPPTEEDQPGESGGDWPGRAHGLSAREAEIVALITEGLTNEDIARTCFLSINTIKTYIRSSYRKMGVTRRPQAVRWGLEHGMTPRRRPAHDEAPAG